MRDETGYVKGRRFAGSYVIRDRESWIDRKTGVWFETGKIRRRVRSSATGISFNKTEISIGVRREAGASGWIVYHGNPKTHASQRESE